jgi:GT2 family glycosyltransferase
MKVAAITLTYNRLELTKKTLESFYSKTKVDYHVIVDNASTDGTQEWVKSRYPHIFLEKNYGIATAFDMALRNLTDYDFVLKLDNDIETVTEEIVEKMVKFHELNGMKFVCSPVDLNLDKNYAPHSHGKAALNGINVSYVTHTGGAFQLIPMEIALKLSERMDRFLMGDYAIGPFYKQNGYKPVYLLDLEMKHIGLNQTSPNYIL